ncbi:MAG TPA: phage holin family protein [Syntrophomonadaceae bacterium]|nr:phage holin family protein [Syntrophomonadaceae bacterium]HPR93857.1 phage holin family protein [Syntrophomonadaceae bacterium]
MRGWLLRWLLNIIAILITAYLIPGFELTFWGAIVGSIFLGIVNAIIRPVLIILTLPLNIVTLGLFTLVINGFTLWLTAITVKGFDVTGFGAAILSALVLSIVSFVISYFVKDR